MWRELEKMLSHENILSQCFSLFELSKLYLAIKVFLCFQFLPEVLVFGVYFGTFLPTSVLEVSGFSSGECGSWSFIVYADLFVTVDKFLAVNVV